MLKEEKIRLMIRLADYEQGQGKIDLERTRYYKMDYIRLQILKTLVSVTGAVFLVILLLGMYHIEYIITNAMTLDYAGMGKFFLVIYILLLCLFSAITISVATVQYEASKTRVKDYYVTLQELLQYYDREEAEVVARDSLKEDFVL
nr:hypothetical protein [Eubacterium sp.]